MNYSGCGSTGRYWLVTMAKKCASGATLFADNSSPPHIPRKQSTNRVINISVLTCHVTCSVVESNASTDCILIPHVSSLFCNTLLPGLITTSEKQNTTPF